MTTPQLIPIGRIVGVFGVKGWVKIYSNADPPENLLAYSPWYLFQSGQWRVHPLDDARAHGKGLVAKLVGCEDRDQASTLVGCDIAVDRALLPELPPGEYYWTDLIGLSVLNKQGETLGTVSHLYATGANDVLVVNSRAGEIWIPYVPERYILSVDMINRRITVDWDVQATEADNAL
jgi:16S rRNA processing protein RimM